MKHLIDSILDYRPRENPLFEMWRNDREKALSSQAERYEAAINPAYMPEQKEEPKPQMIRFKRPKNYGRVSHD